MQHSFHVYFWLTCNTFGIPTRTWIRFQTREKIENWLKLSSDKRLFVGNPAFDCCYCCCCCDDYSVRCVKLRKKPKKRPYSDIHLKMKTAQIYKVFINYT